MTNDQIQMTNEEPLLSLRNVHAFYGHVHALKGVSITVNRGEIVTLIGSNGAGKSTTLRTISGLLKPRDGEIVFQGKSIGGKPAHEIAALGIGHSPEGRRIFPKLTVEENLEIGAYLVRDPDLIRERMSRVYELFPRLGERKKQDGGTLSGGEQQMLAMGRALMQDPALLMLDEPTLGLAPVLVDQIFEIVVKLNSLGKTILLVEQNAWQALQIAHRGYVLQTGTITLEGPAKDLANNDAVKASYLGG
jgi:branched-chain amino acid transport system ATP-binding protein